MSETDPKSTIEDLYQNALEKYNDDEGESFLDSISSEYLEELKVVVEHADTQKAVNTVLLTSVLKKSINPEQDIRKHQNKMDGGYSGRTLDTNNVTPFMKDNFPRFAMGESGWLTRSLEQPEPYNLDFPGEIRNKDVKNAFLHSLQMIEEEQIDPERALIAQLLILERKSSVNQADLSDVEESESLNIELIYESVKEHIHGNYAKGGQSRIPVLAVFSVYELVVSDVDRYKGKELLELGTHTTPDTQSSTIGDVEVVDENGEYFEAVEVKHNITTTYYNLVNTENKIRNSDVDRYYFLTTAEKEIEDDRKKIHDFINKMNREEGCEIILNGVLPTLKYYLRLVDDPREFISTYTENLQEEYEQNTDLKKEHVNRWNQIIEDLPVS